MTHEEELAAVAAIADTDPSRIKGWALLIDNGSTQAEVYTALDFTFCCAMIIRVAEVIMESAS